MRTLAAAALACAAAAPFARPVAADPLAFATNQGGNDVSVVDLANGTVVATIPVGESPAGVSVAPDGASVWVTNPGDGTVSIIDVGALEVRAAVELGPSPLAIVAGDEAVYVADFHEHRVSALDPDTGEVTGTAAVGRAPSGLALSADGATLWVANRDDDDVLALDASTLEPRGGGGGGGRADGRVRVGTHPFGIALEPGGQRLWVANVLDDTVSVVDVDRLETVATIDVGERPYAVAFGGPHGRRAFVTNQYGDTVSVIDVDALETLATVDVGEYPEGVAASPDGARVLVANWFDDSVSVIDAVRLEVVDTVSTGSGTRAYGNFVAPRRAHRGARPGGRVRMTSLDLPRRPLGRRKKAAPPCTVRRRLRS